MEILGSVAAKVVELTVEPIVRQVGYLLCYRNNFKELKNQVEELQTEKERIKREVEAESRNGRKILSDVLRWQESVTKTLDEAEELCEDPSDVNAGCSKWSFPNLKSRHQRSRKAVKMANIVVEMKGKGNFDKGVAYIPHLDVINNFPATRASDELESRNSVKEEIMLSLKDPKVSKIGVYGIGGVGKTTLVREVAKQVKEDKLFDEVVIITRSQTSPEKIQDEIAEQLGLHLEEKTSSILRAYYLCERIKKEKTILIILDDLREKLDLDKLGIPSLDTWGKIDSEKVGVPPKDDCKGCKLLLTSRGQDILQQNDTQKNFSLQVLNVQESWSLFEAMVGDVVEDDDFRTVATDVAQRCVGWPVLIVTIAKSLKYNKDNISYWKDTLNNLKRVDNKDMNDTLFTALEFNFNRLEDEVKKVFLLCGVMGTSILFSDLLKYVIGLGIFKHINAIEDARNRLYRITDDLKKSCLLVEDDARTERVKMHDIAHKVAKSIASKYAFSKISTKWQEWQRNDIPERCTQIILEHCFIKKLPERLDCPHLSFLCIDSTDNRTLEIPDSFFEGAGNLEVLDLTGIIISSLPISFSSLTKLKSLCLYSCSLKDMNRIGALLNLEILSLVGSSIECFPSEIGQLTMLRMLDLSKSGIGTTLPNIWCKLTKIEELYMGDASINWEVESSTKQKRNASLAKLGHLTGLTALELQIREAWLLPKDIPFDKLERYKVVIGEKWEWLGNKGTSRLLKVKLDTNIHRERGIKTLIKSVEDLHLDKICGVSNVLFELNGNGFPLLKHLHIQNNGEIQHIINSVERNQTHALFPKLETLLLHNLNNLVKICHGPIRENSFRKLKVLKVKKCDQLVYLFSVSMVKACSQIVEIQVSECNSMKRIVSIERADRGNSIDEKIEFVPLRSLTLQHLPTIGEFCSHESRANVPTQFFSAKVKFYNLETLKLSSVNLKNIWDDNQSLAPYLIQNLANLTVEDCSGLKYLFSSSIVGKLSNLKQLEIGKCDMMEEIIATEEISGAASGEVLFPKLETIIIKDMQNLKTIWHLILASNSLACFKTLKVKNCEKIEKIFPEYMNGAFASLETLKVQDCKSVKEIFQLAVNVVHTRQLKYITLLRLPQLKQIWSRGSPSSLHFKNLQVVRVEGCGDLEYLFPFSIAKHLPQLEAIIIKNAERMKEVVLEREEPLDNLVKFELNTLTSIVLWNLQDLQGFCAGNHNLSCPLLKILEVYNCPKLKLFKKQDTSSHGRLSDVNLHTQQPLFTLEEVIDNLEQLHLNNEDASMIFQSQVPRDHFRKLNFLGLSELEDAQDASPYWFLQNISSLERLGIQESSFKVIFQDEMPQDENGEIDIKTRLKGLGLYKLYELQHICKQGCQLDPVLDVLEELYVDECSNLKHLVPSSVTFKHLTYLEVQNCGGLIHLMTSSTAQSMVKLTTLKIGECDLLERILEEDGRESNSQIEFSVLEALELESLPKLNSFCSSNCFLKLPLLEKLVIRQCPRLKAFATSGTSSPLLREILTDEKDGKGLCDGDINSTVNMIFQQNVAFSYMEHLELSQYPELGGDVWNNHVKCGIFGNLKILVIHKCDFFSKVLLPLNLLKELSKLEELEVRECDSLETLFELPNTNEGGIMEKVTIHLKRVKLFGLPKLKHIWKQNSQEIIGFENFAEIPYDHNQGMHTSKIQGFREITKEGDIHHQPPTYSIAPLKQSWSSYPQKTHRFCNLEVMHVEDCDALEYLFPFSIASGLLRLEQIMVKDAAKMKEIVSKTDESLDCPPKLEELHIESCGVEEIVPVEEGLKELKFDFPQLTILKLFNLTRLTNFYPKRFTLECPSLKELNIRGCEELQIFAFDRLNAKPLREGDIDLNSIALLYIEKVPRKLEELPLNEKDTMMILNGNYEKNLFRSIKRLHLQQFQETPMKFLNNLIQIFPTITTLQARCSSFEALFPSKEIGHCNIESPSQIKTLWLFQLQKLEHIWNDDSASHPLVQNLEDLFIEECPNLIRLAPPSASFKTLTSLKVKDCNGLMYFMTTCTAKSLVHLTSLEVSNCGMLEEAVMTNEGESEEEITFESLEYLELNCLSSFRSVCSGKHTLIFPSLVTLKVIGCHKMQNFSSGVIIAPFLKLVEVENRKKRWMGDLNTTIKQLLMEKAIEEGVEGDDRESLNIHKQSSHIHQNSASTSRALSSKERVHGAKSKAAETLYNSVTSIQETQTIEGDFVQDAQNTLRFITVQDADLGAQDETIDSPLVQATHQGSALQNQEMHEFSVERPLVQHSKIALSTPTVYDAGVGTQETQESKRSFSVPEDQNVSSTSMVNDTAHGIPYEAIGRPFVQATHQGLSSPSTVQHSDIRNQEMYNFLEKALVPIVQNVLRSSKVDNIALQNQEIYEINVERPLVQSTKFALNTPTVSDGADTENKEMHETIQRPLVQHAEDTLITTSVQDIATGTHVMHENIHKPFAQATQNACDITIVQTKGELLDSDIHLGKNLFHQSTTSSMATDYKKTVGTQETYESKSRFSAHDAQNVLSPIHHTAIDPAPSQASNAPSSSTTPLADVCSNFKELDISLQLLPYLEAGVKQHPQVLNWLNTKRRTVFASSSFSLFAEVTRILRTTRRGNLTEDDRSYIRECCAVLQGVGFDDGWISYVLRRIEARADGEDLEWKVEEVEAQLESINKDLASMDESLGLLRDKTSRLHGYICLSTLINALLVIMLFFSIIYVYQKKN